MHGEVIDIIEAISSINYCDAFGILSRHFSVIFYKLWYVMCEALFPHGLHHLYTCHVSTLRYPFLSNPVPFPLSSGLPFLLSIFLLLFPTCPLLLILLFLTSLLILTHIYLP